MSDPPRISPSGPAGIPDPGSFKPSDQSNHSLNLPSPQDLDSLGESVKKMRTGQGDARNTESVLNNVVSTNNIEASKDLRISEEAFLNALNESASATTSTSRASTLRFEAAVLLKRAEANPRDAERLKSEARRKLLEAFHEEFKATVARNNAYVAEDETQSRQVQAHDAESKADTASRGADEAGNTWQDLNVSSSDLDSSHKEQESLVENPTPPKRNTALFNIFGRGQNNANDPQPSFVQRFNDFIRGQGRGGGNPNPQEIDSGTFSLPGARGNFGRSKSSLPEELLDRASLAGKIASSSGNSFLQAARALLRAVLLVTMNAVNNPNPIVQLAKNLTNKTLTEQAIAYLEAGLVDSTIQGTAVNQQIILTKAQANTLHGDAETNIAYWKEVLQENKQLQKDTHDLAKRA